MAFAGPFPQDILQEITRYPGNQKCCDCSSLDTDWGSVNHGTLLCLECAGKHRSLGVQVSFVRSIHMDTWTRAQVEMMRQGGNGQIREFFKKLQIENSPITTLYSTHAASHYRERLSNRVEKIMSGQIVAEPRHFRNPVENSTEEKKEKRRPKSKEKYEKEITTVSFGPGSMGMTLTKDFRAAAVVTKLVPGGAANMLGVLIDDAVVGVSGKAMTDYDEILHMIPLMPRPLQITFSRSIKKQNSTPAKGVESPVKDDEPKQRTVSSRTPSQGSQGVRIAVRVRSLRKKSAPAGTDSDANGDMSNGIKPSSSPTKPFTKSKSQSKQSASAENTDSIEDPGDAGRVEEEGVDERNDEETKEAPAYLSDKQNTSMHPETPSIHDGYEDEEGDVADEDEEYVYIEPGSKVKVYKKGSWRSAVVKRIHKEGTFKVIFADGTSESHVTVDRIGISEDDSSPEMHSVNGDGKSPKKEKVEKTLATEKTSGDLDAVSMKLAAELAFEESGEVMHVHSASTSLSNISQCDENSDFVVEATENLEAWIEGEESVDPSQYGVVQKQKALKQAADNIEIARQAPVVDVEEGKDYRAVFPAAPLGLTLTKLTSGAAEVTRLNPAGQAEALGVKIGDMLIGINTNWIKGYDEAMATLSLNKYPIALVFRRSGKSVIMKAAGSVAEGSKVFVKTVADQLGYKKESLLRTPVARKLANNKTTVLKDNREAMRMSKDSNADSLIRDDIAKMSTRKWLPAECGPSEFDVSFGEGELGCRLEERVALTTESVVSAVASDGQAAAKGVIVGCTVVGVSGELFLSHAHTIATLRHSKRPVVVRFKRPAGF